MGRVTGRQLRTHNVLGFKAISHGYASIRVLTL
jgi:hypothetical protein